jgi:mannose-6-phosphate isomerase-like protein (cupin superfamily)
MPTMIEAPSVITTGGQDEKRIDEYLGRVQGGETTMSVALMQAPSGWREPGQRPEFEEFTLVLSGMLCVEHADGAMNVRAGQAVITHPGEWVRYSTPEPEGAQYVAICRPAFSPETVHRDAEP